MPLVVDASVVVKWFLTEAFSEHAARVLRGPHHLMAPDLLWAETASVLWKRCRRDELSIGTTRRVLHDLLAYSIATVPHRGLLGQALLLAARLDHPPYDCLYLALAEQQGCPLVSADRRLRDTLLRTSLRHRMLWIEDVP